MIATLAAAASPKMQAYFDAIEQQVQKEYALAAEARKKGLDPDPKVDIKLAKNMAERVEGLISVVAPQLINSGVTERIIELEKEYGALDWRVALKIALEVAQEKFCTFVDKREAMEVGIRIGFAYQTAGIVAAPLEGFTQLKIRKTFDGKEYFVPCYAGPIRGAGGTAAAFSLLLTDYMRVHMGFAKWDPSEKEVNRYKTEIYDYHERVTNLQYLPSLEELDFLIRHLPVQVDGEPTETKDVSNYKDTPRVETNKIRGGICLVLAEGLSQKAPKLWKRLEEWGKEFGLDWDFLGEFLILQKNIKAKKKIADPSKKEKLSPNYTFIADMVAGRPVLTFPMAPGGFRLRYGRSRTSGFSAASINPATMLILDRFVAIGTQLKVERPGKAAAITTCDIIHGPTVLLEDGTVQQIETMEAAKACKDKVKEILYMGDILFNYGDFSENGHILVPCGYNEEWWMKELERAMQQQNEEKITQEKKTYLRDAKQIKSFAECKILSEKYKIPLHPDYTYFWSQPTKEQFQELLIAIKNIRLLEEKITLPYKTTIKRTMELLGISHTNVNNEFILLEKDHAAAFLYALDIQKYEDAQVRDQQYNPEKTILENINKWCPTPLRNKAGITIGARMGRPEKAKIRELTGSPHILFPIGNEGGRLRSFQAAIEAKKVTADFPLYSCETCSRETIFSVCQKCQSPGKQIFFCAVCGKMPTKDCPHHGKGRAYKKQEIPIYTDFAECLKYLGISNPPNLVKGIKGTSNEDHVIEYLGKGILRAKHSIYVNKDGTIRYDMSELPITHFKPAEIGTSIEKLKMLGYETDMYGQPIQDTEQICELYPQDIILPGATDTLDEPCDAVLYRTTAFIDELLERVYKLPGFYNLKTKQDIVGHLTICLAPHISAGMVGRIIGFSKTQGFFAHPLFHAALRRDCFSYNTFLPIYDGQSWKNWKIGDLVEKLNPQRVVDAYGTKEIKVEGYKTIGVDKKGNIVIAPIFNFTKHSCIQIIEIKTKTGRILKVTENHKCLIKEQGIKTRRADELQVGQKFLLPKKIPFESKIKKEEKELLLLNIFSGREDVVIKNIAKQLKREIKDSERSISVRTGIKYRDIRNFFYRDSIPLSVLEKIKEKYSFVKLKIYKNGKISAKRDTVGLPLAITLSEEFMGYLGLYVAEGYSRYVKKGKGCAQVYVAGFDDEVRNRVIKFGEKIGLKHAENKIDRVTFCSRLWYEIITNHFCCGSTAYEKRVPAFLFQAEKRLVAAFLRGYFEGDGSVSLSDKRVTCDSVSNSLLQDLNLLLLRFGIFSKFYTYTKKPGGVVKKFYEKKGFVPEFTITKLTIPSDFVSIFNNEIGFISEKKKNILQKISKRRGTGMRLDHDEQYVYDEIVEKKYLPPEESYCLHVENNIVLANGILTKQCDGDEASVSLLLDGLINFSRRYLPARIGARTMDAPLVLTSKLIPTEVDDQVLGLDVVSEYPLELYETAEEYKPTKEVKIPQIRHRVNTPGQYEGMGFTHDTSNINLGVSCSAYKELPSMEEKLNGQMALAVKIRAVSESEVARFVIEKHFLKDTKGNLRKFSQQKFRCVKCNESYRRPPLLGKCLKCGGRIIFTISQGSVIKYLQLSLGLAEKYNISLYLKQTLDLLRRRIDCEFGIEKELQEGLGKWFEEKKVELANESIGK